MPEGAARTRRRLIAPTVSARATRESRARCCGGGKLAQWPWVLQTICLPDLGFCPGAPAGEEPEDFQGMKQESWLHAHMRCKAGHLSGSLRGGEEGVSVIRSRLLSLEIARAALRGSREGWASRFGAVRGSFH